MEDNKMFEDMRQQIALLKEKLDKENIVNDKLLRASMQQRLGVIRRNQILEYVCALFVIVFGSLSFLHLGMSWWFVGTTIVLMILCMVINYFMHFDFNRQNLYSDDLLTVAKTMKQLKHRYIQYLFFGVPAIIIWLALLVYDLKNVLEDTRLWLGMVISAGIGAVIGACIGLAMTFRNRKACDDIIRQIED